MIVFGFSLLMLNLFCLAFGDSAKGISALFALGSKGIPVSIAFQFLCLSAAIIFLRFLFFTDAVIPKMPIWLRSVLMLTLTTAAISAFIIFFHWFPVNMWQPWCMFLLCFALSFLGSLFVVTCKERLENKKMEEALKKIQQKEDKLL